MDYLSSEFPWRFTLGEGMLKDNEQRIIEYCTFTLSMSGEERDRHYKCISDLYHAHKCERWAWFMKNYVPECSCKYCRRFIQDVDAEVSQQYQVGPSLPKSPQGNSTSKPTGYVYLMKHERAGTVKIGYSRNPKEREGTLQAEDPNLKLISSWPGTRQDERALHERFASVRTRGEWFGLTAIDITELEVEFIGVPF